MPNANYSYLSAARINGIMQGLQDPRLLPQQLIWLGRVASVPTLDEEIMARYVGTITVSDIIADDAKAVVYDQGQFRYETTKIPNIKHGIGMNQSMLNQLRRLQMQYAGPRDLGIFTDWENRTIQAINLGINQRIESLLVGMMIDNYDYDRLGIKLSGITWGMPSDLKVTPSVAWDSTSATPVTDINTILRIARTRYGQNFNRVTMSTQAFMYLVQTTEFQNQAKIFGFGLAGVPGPTLNIQSDSTLRELFRKMIGGMEVEFYDARYFVQDTTGTILSYPFLPITKVILSNTADDNNPAVMDWANGIVAESVVGAATGMLSVKGTTEQYGPYSYATAPPDLNPPSVTYWGVKRGFPRKHVLQSTAVLTVGTFVDTITNAVPFTGT